MTTRKATAVQSSMISEIAYIALGEDTMLEIGGQTVASPSPLAGAMIVHFHKTNDIWGYTPLTQEQYDDLSDSDSIGKAFIAGVRNNPAYGKFKLEDGKWVFKEGPVKFEKTS